MAFRSLSWKALTPVRIFQNSRFFCPGEFQFDPGNRPVSSRVSPGFIPGIARFASGDPTVWSCGLMWEFPELDRILMFSWENCRPGR